mmetsp:Transcript_23776/g.55113  ORF Transcript_23776/g.55113 Transcript_23776/m.55113 type:complete len:310 (-) Transcript_23776:278-1207(-)
MHRLDQEQERDRAAEADQRERYETHRSTGAHRKLAVELLAERSGPPVVGADRRDGLEPDERLERPTPRHPPLVNVLEHPQRTHEAAAIGGTAANALHHFEVAGIENERVVAERLLGKPVVVLALRLGGESAKHAVPDDEYSRVVAIARRSVVHPVVRGRVEDALEPPRQPLAELGVYPEHVERVELCVRGELHRVEAEDGERQVEEKTEDGLQGTLPQAHGEVVVLARVVDRVCRPKHVELVQAAMAPVVSEVFAKQERHIRKVHVLLAIDLKKAPMVVRVPICHLLDTEAKHRLNRYEKGLLEGTDKH